MKLTPTPIRLIATDMDGTFLGLDGMPTQTNCDAVLRAAELGIPTVFATGRPARWLQPLEVVRAAHPIVIASNGAVIIDLETGCAVHAFPLDPTITTQVVADVRLAVPDASFAVEYLDTWGREDHYCLNEYQEAEEIAPIEDLLTHDMPVKLLIRSDTPTLDLAARVSLVVGDRLTVTFSMVSPAGFLEVSPPGISKASALTRVLTQMGISPAQVAAFGDMPNDLAMLDLVGHPFIMDNAHDLLKERGFPTCGHHDDSAFGMTVQTLLGLTDES